MSEIKKFMYVNRKAPYGTIYAWESLEVVLIGAAFEQDVSLAFIDDGVYQLTKGQDTKGIAAFTAKSLICTSLSGRKYPKGRIHCSKNP